MRGCFGGGSWSGIHDAVFSFFFFGGANRGAERRRSAGGECMVLFTSRIGIRSILRTLYLTAHSIVHGIWIVYRVLYSVRQSGVVVVHLFIVRPG